MNALGWELSLSFDGSVDAVELKEALLLPTRQLIVLHQFLLDCESGGVQINERLDFFIVALVRVFYVSLQGLPGIQSPLDQMLGALRKVCATLFS